MNSFQTITEIWVLPKLFYNEGISATDTKYWTKEKTLWKVMIKP